MLFAFILLYFSIYFTAAPASLTVVRKRTDYTRNESSWEPSFPGAKVPGNFHSWERRFPLGTFTPKNENTGERKVLIPTQVPNTQAPKKLGHRHKNR